MNTILWIISGLLAAIFLVAGFNKILIPQEKLAEAPGGAWASEFSPTFLKTLGSLEILGALGLILPAVLGIAEILVPLAAIGLAMVMVGAVTLRLRRRETAPLVVNSIYLVMAVFVAIGRLSFATFA